MALDQETQDKIKAAVGPLVLSLGTAALFSAAADIIKSLVVTNVKESNLTGDTEMKPTGNDTTINKVETSAKDTDASLAKDEVKAKSGDLSAMNTDAMVTTGEATALESGATAARTKAGAADIETKALKMT